MSQGRYASVNGLNLYYELYGTGQPLILLHGGLGTIGMFEQNVPALAVNRQVIEVELQGRGHTMLFSPMLLSVVISFLDAPMPEGK